MYSNYKVGRVHLRVGKKLKWFGAPPTAFGLAMAIFAVVVVVCKSCSLHLLSGSHRLLDCLLLVRVGTCHMLLGVHCPLSILTRALNVGSPFTRRLF